MEQKDKRQQLLAYMNQCAGTDVALAFSGGVDSSLLLKMACDCAGEQGTKVYAVTFQTRLHPPCDLEAAKKIAEELKAEHVILQVDELEMEEICYNPENRCYLCKKNLFGHLKKFADEKGIPCLMDGTNEDDLHVYRPGLRAVKELGIRSPLLELGMTKRKVRALAAEYGISVADRPSAPCLATRFPYGTALCVERMRQVDEGERFLRELGFYNVRLRAHGDTARIEVDRRDMGKLLEHAQEIAERIRSLDFSYVTLDLEGFRSGSMDIGLFQEYGKEKES